MKLAAEKLKEALREATVYDINNPIVSNADAKPYPSEEEIKRSPG